MKILPQQRLNPLVKLLHPDSFIITKHASADYETKSFRILYLSARYHSDNPASLISRIRAAKDPKYGVEKSLVVLLHLDLPGEAGQRACVSVKRCTAKFDVSVVSVPTLAEAAAFIVPPSGTEDAIRVHSSQRGNAVLRSIR